ncbi:MAG TPA: DinB family protein [Candidatus Angelobacter sp.]|nr:DinB family protein [Candidatus Angelobacter sp.]
MNIAATYDYLIRARRDLWAALENTPNELLSRQLLSGAELHCIKDLLFHIAAVEDGWIHEDILREPPVLESTPVLKDTQGGPAYADIPLETLLNYWKAVEKSTLLYLPRLTDEELKRVVVVHDSPTDRFSVDGLLWHVMIHEMRHTAQIAVLLRTQNIKPPSLDLLFYLPAS